jgi:nicotinate-nucleotide--dimethylbenzimidazole phosphoribosyltransferase
MAFGMEALAKQPDLLIPGVITAEAARTAAAVCLALFGGEASTGPTIPSRWPPPSPAPGPRAWATTRWKSCASWAAARPPPSPARSWPRACRRCRCCWTATPPAPPPPWCAPIEPGAIDHCLAAHVSPAKGHAKLLEILDKRPLLALDILDEEGVGGASALALVKLACEVR